LTDAIALAGMRPPLSAPTGTTVRLRGKRVLVTGASSGIGEAGAELFARNGAEVIVVARREDLLREVADRITANGGTATAVPCDLSDLDAVDGLVDTVGDIDILVNNAGIVRDGSIFNMSVDDFDAVLKVHLRGTWIPCKHAALHWRALNKDTGQKVNGRIINTVSGAGLTGNFGQSNYAPAKAAIASLTQTLSLELYRMGVTVNAVGPAAATRITGTMPNAPAVIEADEIPEDEWNRMDPAVSSPLVAWLASDEADHVTGQIIRAVAENIILMKGWADGPTINNKGQRWDATKLGQQLATDVFFTRAPGLRY